MKKESGRELENGELLASELEMLRVHQMNKYREDLYHCNQQLSAENAHLKERNEELESELTKTKSQLVKLQQKLSELSDNKQPQISPMSSAANSNYSIDSSSSNN